MYLSLSDPLNTTSRENSRCVRNVAENIVTALFPINAVNVVKGIQAEAELSGDINAEYADVYIFRV